MIHGLPVDGRDLRGHGADHFGRTFDAALPLYQIENGIAILGSDVDQETLAMPGGEQRFISAIIPCWTKYTVSVNITPTPKATSTDCACAPGPI